MSTRDQHVVPDRKGGWAVRRSGASRASGVFERRGEALLYAKRLARREGAVLYIHGRDGTVLERQSHKEA